LAALIGQLVELEQAAKAREQRSEDENEVQKLVQAAIAEYEVGAPSYHCMLTLAAKSRQPTRPVRNTSKPREPSSYFSNTTL
jgi:hypothetical protein